MSQTVTKTGNKVDPFIRTYHGKGVEDCGAYTGDDFKSFARKFRNYLKRVLPECKIVGYNSGHYYVSGFLQYNEKYVYFSYDVPRRGYPMDFYSHGINDHVLIRRAKNSKDYTGERNHFTSVAEMQDGVRSLFCEGMRMM